MNDQTGLRLGPYRLIRPLEPGRLAERWLALHEQAQSSHTVHRFGICADKAEQRRFLFAVEAISELEHPHLLPIEQYSFMKDGRPWVVAPYVGNQTGIVTLRRLLEDRDGNFGPLEVQRGVTQLLDAMSWAHERGHHHGELAMDEILVDRRGSLWIEMFGMARRLDALGPANQELVRDEVRSVVEIAYRMLTGVDADEPLIRPSRLVRRLDRRWDAWFLRGLDASDGFDTPLEAVLALPGHTVDVDGITTRNVFRRLRRSQR
ncbi:MAG: protein kinase [Phycisphaerales bacterium]|nr:protein kinase [Phycisphaerales bacterium]